MKRLLSIILIMVFVLSLSISPVFASGTGYEKVLADVNRTNEKIEKMIDKAQKEADKVIEKYSREPEIRKERKNPVELEEKIDKIINKLVEATNKEAAQMIKRAANKGFKVVCQWVPVEIGGRTVMIDPLRILGF